MRLRELRLELVLTLVVLVLNLAWLGRVGLFDVDEAIFAEATREMVVSGDYVTPTYNGELRSDKPPMSYWLMSVPMRVFGPTAFAARFTSAVAGALLTLLLMLFGRAVWGRREGVAAGLVFATCLYGFYLSHWGATDMTLSLCMAAGWMALYLAAERRSPRWMLIAGAALGCAMLVKGPVALVLPAATWLLYLAWRGDAAERLRATRWWWGLAVCVAVILPWCLAIYHASGLEFFRAFLGYHNLDRLTHKQSGHGGPFWTFVPIALAGLAPWTGYGVWGIADAWPRRRTTRPADPAAVYTLLWLLLTLGLFSLSKTKLPSYIAPLFGAFALLAGRVVARELGELRPARGGAAAVAFGNALVLLALGAALWTADRWLPQIASFRRELGGETIVPGRGPAVAGAVIVGASLLAMLVRARGGRVAVAANAGAGAVAGLAVWLALTPVVYRYQEGTLRAMTVTARDALRGGGRLATLNCHLPSVLFWSHHPLSRFVLRPDPRESARTAVPGTIGRATTRTALAGTLNAPEPMLLIVQSLRKFDALDGIPHRVWAQRDGYELVANFPPPPTWQLPPAPWTEADIAAWPPYPLTALAQMRDSTLLSH